MNIEELHVLFCIENDMKRVTTEGLPFYRNEYVRWLESRVLKESEEGSKQNYII